MALTLCKYKIEQQTAGITDWQRRLSHLNLQIYITIENKATTFSNVQESGGRFGVPGPMHFLMFCHTKLGGEGFGTHLALERLLAGVNSHMVRHLRFMVERLAAHLAQEGFLKGANRNMLIRVIPVPTYMIILYYTVR